MVFAGTKLISFHFEVFKDVVTHCRKDFWYVRKQKAAFYATEPVLKGSEKTLP